MAEDKRWAWCLEIGSTPPIYAGTVDLHEDAAEAELGAVYTRRFKAAGITLDRSLPFLFYGIASLRPATFVLDNSDGAFDPTDEWRLTPVTLRHYDRDTTQSTVDAACIILDAQFVGTEALITIGSHNDALMQELLPWAVINPATGSPFASSATPGVPPPVVYGTDVPIRPPSAASELAIDPETEEYIALSEGYEYLVGYGTIHVRAAYIDEDRDKPGFERLGAFAAAPGNPTYASTTTFTVTGNQAVRFYTQDEHGAGAHVRFKTTAGGDDFLYSVVKTYTGDGGSGGIVTIEDALLDAGLSEVEIAGDYLVNREGYQNVTAGLLPVPAVGADFTAIRLFDQEEGGLFALVSNPDWPTVTTQISDVIEDILTDATWGLSVRAAQTIDAASFAQASSDLDDAGLVGAISGALAYDQQQRAAGPVLSELLMMCGGILDLNAAIDWTLEVDTAPAAPAVTFVLGSGEELGPRLKRVQQHGKRPLSDAVRNVVLHWLPLGRAQNRLAMFTAREYGRTSTAACTGVGRDLHLFSMWIRSPTIAEKVAYYVAQKLKGADEQCVVVAGVEARTLELGQQINLSVPSDSITGTWQIAGIQKSLAEVTLTCFRANADAYGEPADVLTSDTPSESEQRTPPGAGANLLGNPAFAPPLFGRDAGNWSGFGLLDWRVDASRAVAQSVLGGHYLTLTWGALQVTPPVGPPLFTPSLFTSSTVPPDQELIFSFYCDQSSGLFVNALFYETNPAGGGEFFESEENPGQPDILGLYPIIIRDPTDTTGANWARQYCRFSSPTPREGFGLGVRVLIGASAEGTYRFAAAKLEATHKSGRRPSAWNQHMPQPRTRLEFANITFNGNVTYTAANLIDPGWKVLGVTVRVETEIVFGTATSFAVGTPVTPDAWGTEITITQVDESTSATDFIITHDTYFPSATHVLITGNGTITSGRVRITVEYEEAQEASAA